MEILRCPFCGKNSKDYIQGEFEKYIAVQLHSYRHGFRVECVHCVCCGPWSNKPDSAIEAWNAGRDQCEFGIFGGKDSPRCTNQATMITNTGYKCCAGHAPRRNGKIEKRCRAI